MKQKIYKSFVVVLSLITAVFSVLWFFNYQPLQTNLVYVGWILVVCLSFCGYVYGRGKPIASLFRILYLLNGLLLGFLFLISLLISIIVSSMP